MSVHERREAGAAGRVPHPRELPLARVRIRRIPQPGFTVAVTLSFPLHVLLPVHARIIADDDDLHGLVTRDVYYVDGLRTAFGRAGPEGIFWRTRADDMAVKVVRELLRRNPELPPERIGGMGAAVLWQRA
jgi:hypothetical protein